MMINRNRVFGGFRRFLRVLAIFSGFSDFEWFFGFLSVFCGLMRLNHIPNHSGAISSCASDQTSLLTPILFLSQKPEKPPKNRQKFSSSNFKTFLYLSFSLKMDSFRVKNHLFKDELLRRRPNITSA